MFLKRFELSDRALARQAIKIEQDVGIDENEPLLRLRGLASHDRLYRPSRLFVVGLKQFIAGWVRFSHVRKIALSRQRRLQLPPQLDRVGDVGALMDYANRVQNVDRWLGRYCGGSYSHRLRRSTRAL
jgi:hypothetical protein